VTKPARTVRGTEGVYFFASQRLYFERSGENNNGLTTWIQLAATNSDFVSTHRFIGSGLAYFGPFDVREIESAGFAFA
jgi:porin